MLDRVGRTMSRWTRPRLLWGITIDAVEARFMKRTKVILCRRGLRIRGHVGGPVAGAASLGYPTLRQHAGS